MATDAPAEGKAEVRPGSMKKGKRIGIYKVVSGVLSFLVAVGLNFPAAGSSSKNQLSSLTLPHLPVVW